MLGVAPESVVAAVMSSGCWALVGPTPILKFNLIQSSNFRISMPLRSGLSSTTTWEDSLSSYFLAMSIGMISVADTLLVIQTFDKPFVNPLVCDNLS